VIFIALRLTSGTRRQLGRNHRLYCSQRQARRCHNKERIV